MFVTVSSVAVNVPEPVVAFAGTSLAPFNVALNVTIVEPAAMVLLPHATAVMTAAVTATAIVIARVCIGVSSRGGGARMERMGVGERSMNHDGSRHVVVQRAQEGKRARRRERATHRGIGGGEDISGRRRVVEAHVVFDRAEHETHDAALRDVD